MSPLKELIDEGNALNPVLSNLRAAFTVLEHANCSWLNAVL